MALQTTARADDACTEKLRAYQDVVDAGEVEISHLKQLHQADQDQVRLTEEARREALEKAKERPSPILPPVVLVVVPFLLGAVAGAYVVVRVSH